MLAQGARSILATQGIRGLYHGLLPTLLRDVPELTLQFSLYEALRYSMQNHGQVTCCCSEQLIETQSIGQTVKLALSLRVSC